VLSAGLVILDADPPRRMRVQVQAFLGDPGDQLIEIV